MQPKGLTFRQGDLSHPPSWAAISKLLADIFDFDVTALDRMGGPDASSMAFSWFGKDGWLAANLTTFALPMAIDGRAVRAAGLQSGAVRPEFRGLGLFRDLIEKALTWCDDQGFETVLLYTDKPGLYEKHGFVVLPQSRFLAETCVTGRAIPPPRRMDLGDPDDLALIQKMLARRKPVSDRFAVARQSEMFLLNTWLSEDVRLDYLQTLDAIIAWRQEDDMVELLDIVATTIPTLGDIQVGLNLTTGRIAVDFVPDLLACNATAAMDDDPLVLMMRGPAHLRPAGPIRLPELAHF